jgi:hypothetical protein
MSDETINGAEGIAEIAMQTPRPPSHADLLRSLERARLLGMRQGIDLVDAIHCGRKDQAFQRQLEEALSPTLLAPLPALKMPGEPNYDTDEPSEIDREYFRGGEAAAYVAEQQAKIRRDLK